MRLVERAGLAALRLVDPERAHGIALAALKAGLVPGQGPVTSPALATELAGLALPNPVGIAAGFDKNAVAVRPILDSGAGFLEIGAVTPRPQPGNPRPRLFRLAADRAVINRFGFNNDGMEAVRPRLEAARGAGIVGVNLGANRDSEDKAGDFAAVLTHLHDVADFFSVNVSSPNTAGLRDLQGRAALEAVLARVLEARGRLPSPARPVFLKIAPDLSDAEVAEVAAVAMAMQVDGIVATNTTTVRHGLSSRSAREAGGLSGRPLFARSTEVLAALFRATEGRLPLIGVGGIFTGADAYAKLRAGATAVQLYTALAYEGLGLVRTILRDLERLLARDGLATVAQARGADAGA